MRYKVEFFKTFEKTPVASLTEGFQTYAEAEGWLKARAADANSIAFRQPWVQVPHYVEDGSLQAPRGCWRISEVG